MDIVTIGIAALLGIAVGVALTVWIRRGQVRQAREMAQELLRANESDRQAGLQAVVSQMEASFGKLSLDALQQTTTEFLKLAKNKLDAERDATSQELSSKKELIDNQLKDITKQLENLGRVTRELEKDREAKFGELVSQLKSTGEVTASLMQTTNSLREALASSKTRGQWGERMADDVLRMAGFVENINYRKQKALDSDRSRPDFTFMLPNDLVLNMDVKFPLDNYQRYVETESPTDRQTYRNNFIRDVKARIKEVTSRGYINPEEKTVDYVLLFIPNEQIYGFIQEQDSSVLDEALKSKVIVCSPLTLFAILAVIRQAVDNFALQQTSDEILSLFGGFKKQWEQFVRKMEQMGKKIADAQKEYERLTTTRRRALEKPLNRIEELRSVRGLPVIENSAPDLLDVDSDDEDESA
jgi:DNA recombination protein RmuC